MNDGSLKLIIAGFGGQGVLFAGKLLAQSAMYEGKNVTWFPSYGAEMRGGTANCTVIISSEMIGSPAVRSADALLIMNDASMGKFEPRLKPGGLLIMNSTLIRRRPERPDIEIISIKATDIAGGLGNSQVANMVMLGAFVGKSGIIRSDTVSASLKEIVPSYRKKIIPLNEIAFKKGVNEFAD